MNPQIEQRWAGRAIVAMGETQTPALLKEFAERLHAVKGLPAHEQATCPLPLLQCSRRDAGQPCTKKAQAGNAQAAGAESSWAK